MSPATAVDVGGLVELWGDAVDPDVHIMILTSPPEPTPQPWWPRALCTCGWESDDCATRDDARDAHADHCADVTTALDCAFCHAPVLRGEARVTLPSRWLAHLLCAEAAAFDRYDATEGQP